MFRRRRPVIFVNGRVWGAHGLVASVRVRRGALDLGAVPAADDVVVDLEGAFVLPGLINAHDHLELNHFGRLKGRERYLHADDWIADLRPRLQADDRIRRNARFPLADRLFIGGLKNVLAGVTTVAHHNPRYPQLGRRFPVRVLARYGWAHSFSMETAPVGASGEPGGVVADSCAATPPTMPFLVHVGEGTDARAVRELTRFAGLACLRPNSVVVHGVAYAPDSWRAAVAAGAGLVWCPASNTFLFGQTLPMADLLAAVPGSLAFVCLGSDSRLTGARDLLDELRHAAETGLPPGSLLPMVTGSAARILRLPAAGRLAADSQADLLIVAADPDQPEDPERALLAARRRDVRLVVIGGLPVIADPAFTAAFDGGRVKTRRLKVDGAPKIAAEFLVRRIERCPIAEPGVEVAR